MLQDIYLHSLALRNTHRRQCVGISITFEQELNDERVALLRRLVQGCETKQILKNIGQLCSRRYILISNMRDILCQTRHIIYNIKYTILHVAETYIFLKIS